MSTRGTSRRPWRRGLLLAGVTAAAGLIVLLAGTLIGAGGLRNALGGNLLGTLNSAQFRLFLIVGAGAVIAMSLIVGWLGFHLARRRRMGAQAGTVLIEFAMLLPFLLMLSLLLVQSSLMMGGYLCVNYASFCAARSAVVYIPQRVGEEEPNMLVDFSEPDISEKLSRIHQAAVWAVMPAGDGGYDRESSYADALTEGLNNFFQQYDETPPGWASGYLRRKLAYAEDNTFVKVEPPIKGEFEAFGPHEDIHVTVRHNLYLSVPYAARLFAVMDADHAVEFEDGKFALMVTVPCTLTNEGVSDEIDVETFPDNDNN